MGMILAARAVVNKRDGEHAEDGMSASAKQPGRDRSPDVALEALARALPERINADPGQVENGLARLVLTVIELLREILEHQAIRRMDGGTLSEEQVERLGLALLKLNERMEELKTIFGLTDEDLNIDLGPLGQLR
jgi:Gas vesicle protein K